MMSLLAAYNKDIEMKYINIRNPSLMLPVIVLAVGVALAGPNGDRPDAKHPWAVHDENRPIPPHVQTADGRPPSDAIVLFDGTQESIDRNWCGDGGKPTKWTVRDGTFVCTPKSGGVGTRRRFGDCQIHVEFKIPDPPGPGLGNSGVYVQHYEIQVIDSSVPMASFDSPWQHANYADGMLGAVYGQNPPLVNAARRPGEWQSYDIVFHPAVWEGDALKAPARITVFANGVLVQDNFPLEGSTDWGLRARHNRGMEPPEGCLYLQDHGNPVAYRNIWVRELPSSAKKPDGDALRKTLAKKTLSLAENTDDLAKRLVWLWESYCYVSDDIVKERIDEATVEYVNRLRTLPDKLDDKTRKEMSNMSLFVRMGIRNGLFAEDCPLAVAIKTRMK